MKTSDFNYDLPKELIAQTPLENRSESRMLVLNRQSGEYQDRHFFDIVDYFKPGDVLVRNNTKVIPARLFGTKQETNAHVEVLLLKQLEDDVWECLCGNAKVIKLNTVIKFGEELSCICIEIGEKGLRKMKMIYQGVFMEALEKLGNTPLPPYIKEKLDDPNRYNTVYAKIEGSAAAPTAGLHFTDEIFQKLKDKGVIVLEVTLHVGLGTFKPVDEEEITDHHMHTEWYHVDKEVADQLNKAKEEGRRIIATGTTSVRTLEANYQKYHCFHEDSDETNIFIYPGYDFKAIDGMITNFHLPQSTLVMLVAAFTSREIILNAYKHAVKERYRFFSFGDAMLIM